MSAAAIFSDTLCDLVVVILTNAEVTVVTVVDDPTRETGSSVLVLAEPKNKEPQDCSGP